MKHLPKGTVYADHVRAGATSSHRVPRARGLPKAEAHLERHTSSMSVAPKAGAYGRGAGTGAGAQHVRADAQLPGPDTAIAGAPESVDRGGERQEYRRREVDVCGGDAGRAWA